MMLDKVPIKHNFAQEPNNRVHRLLKPPEPKVMQDGAEVESIKTEVEVVTCLKEKRAGRCGGHCEVWQAGQCIQEYEQVHWAQKDSTKLLSFRTTGITA